MQEPFRCCCLFSYILKIEQGLDDPNKQISKADNVLLLMFGYLSLALNMQKAEENTHLKILHLTFILFIKEKYTVTRT